VYVCRMGKTRNNYRILMENFLKTAAWKTVKGKGEYD
jgi:hypothetical protein